MTWEPPKQCEQENDPVVVYCGYRPTLPSLLVITAWIICWWSFSGWKMLGGMLVALYAGGVMNGWMVRQHIKQEHPHAMVKRVGRVRGE